MKLDMKAKFEPVFNTDRKPLHKLIPLNTPMAVSIVSSQACNIRCEYCLHSLSNEELNKRNFVQKNMTWDTFIKAVEMLKDFPERIKSISLSGQGEPLCNPLFPDMVSFVKKAGITDDVSVITNGLLLNRENIVKIIDAGLDRMFISLQGMTEEKYEEVCGKKIDFEEFVSNLTFLYEYSRGKCMINIKIADIALEPGDKEKFFDVFGNICDKIHIETIKPLYADVDYTDMLGKNLTEMTVTRFGRPHKKQSACYLSFYMMSVTPMGEIRPCGAPFQGCKGLGNINSTTLVDAWNSTARKKFLIDMLTKKRFENNVCKDCDYPNDVPSENDEIDPYAEDLIKRIECV